jgi:hypothetical protein
MDYEKKYFKYKAKYLKLKQFGGSFPVTDNLIHKKLYNIVNYALLPSDAPVEYIKSPRPCPKLMETDLENFIVDMENEDMAKLYIALLKKNTLVYKNFNPSRMVVADPRFVGKLQNQSTQLLTCYLYDRYGKILIDDLLKLKLNNDLTVIKACADYNEHKIDCTVEEMMTMDDLTHCKTKSLYNVSGSCREPSFESSNVDITDEERDNWLSILEIIKKKISSVDGQKITFIIGAEEELSYFGAGKNFTNINSFVLLINPVSKSSSAPSIKYRYKPYSVVYDNLVSAPTLQNLVLEWDAPFPLSHNKPNSKIVLDEILTIGDKIRLINRMCGTCHRSFYYLLSAQNIEYINEPEQRYSFADTDDIVNCFRSK